MDGSCIRHTPSISLDLSDAKIQRPALAGGFSISPIIARIERAAAWASNAEMGLRSRNDFSKAGSGSRLGLVYRR